MVLCILPCWNTVSWADPDPGHSVTVTDSDASFDSVTVTDDSAPAVSVESGSAGASVTVTGDVSVTNNSGPATGMGVYAHGGSGTGATVDVGGQVSTSSKDAPAIALDIRAMGGESEITVGGVTASSGDRATGVYSDAHGGEAEVTVKGNVDSSSTNSRAEGIYVNAALGESEIEVQGNVSANSENDLASGVIIEAFDGSAEVEIQGNVSADGADGFNNAGVVIESMGTLNDSLGKVSVEGNVTSDNTGVFINHLSGKTIVSVGGSVEADHAGIELYDVESEGDVDIFVQDTISGGDIGILMDKTVSPENVSITTWKIDTKDLKGNGDQYTVAKSGTDGLVTDEDTDWLEINVRYLIKVEPSQEKWITVEGDAVPDPKEKDHGTGLKVAYWNDEVIMKVNVPSGYKLTGAYGDKEQTLNLMKDASGNYYLKVPNGGGVWLSVGLEKLSSDDGGGSAGLPEIQTSSRYANYAGKARLVTITFDRNGGHDRLMHTSPVVKQVPAGTWVAMVEEQMKDGSVFECWYTDDPDTKVSMPGQNFMATHDVTFIAKWVGEDLPYSPNEEDTALLSGFSLTPMEDVEIVDLVAVDGEAIEAGSTVRTESAETEAVLTENEALDATTTMNDALSALQDATEALQAAVIAMTSANDIAVAADGEDNTTAEKETTADDTATKVPAPEISAESIGSGQVLPATLVIDLGNGNKLEVPVNVSLSISLGNPA